MVPIAATRHGYRIAKRSMDIVASSVGLIVTAPMMLAIAAAVRLESHGPILFRQNRIGLGGRPFRLYKFRTMHASADEEAHRLAQVEVGQEVEPEAQMQIPPCQLP